MTTKTQKPTENIFNLLAEEHAPAPQKKSDTGKPVALTPAEKAKQRKEKEEAKKVEKADSAPPPTKGTPAIEQQVQHDDSEGGFESVTSRRKERNIPPQNARPQGQQGQQGQGRGYNQEVGPAQREQRPPREQGQGQGQRRGPRDQTEQRAPRGREFERHSGTGAPIRGQTKRQGAGKGNVGTMKDELVGSTEPLPAVETTQETQPEGEAEGWGETAAATPATEEATTEATAEPQQTQQAPDPNANKKTLEDFAAEQAKKAFELAALLGTAAPAPRVLEGVDMSKFVEPKSAEDQRVQSKKAHAATQTPAAASARTERVVGLNEIFKNVHTATESAPEGRGRGSRGGRGRGPRPDGDSDRPLRQEGDRPPRQEGDRPPRQEGDRPRGGGAGRGGRGGRRGGADSVGDNGRHRGKINEKQFPELSSH